MCTPGLAGYTAAMEETPICASVERDLDLSVDDLVTSVGTTTPGTKPASAGPAAS